jgi:hypothetical protein
MPNGFGLRKAMQQQKWWTIATNQTRHLNHTIFNLEL